MKFDTGFELQRFQKKWPNDPTLPYMTLRMTQRVPMSKVLKNTVTRKENNTVANPPHMGGQPTPGVANPPQFYTLIKNPISAVTDHTRSGIL